MDITNAQSHCEIPLFEPYIIEQSQWYIYGNCICRNALANLLNITIFFSISIK